MELREDLQVAGRIPVEPVGAIRDERVNPLTQAPNPAMPELVVEAARRGWATPEEKKPQIVDQLISIATGDEIEIGPEGITSGPSAKTKVAAAKALAELDQIEYERRNPDAAGRAKGNTNVSVGVGVTNNVFGDIADLLKRAEEQRSGDRQVDSEQAVPTEEGSNDDATTTDT